MAVLEALTQDECYLIALLMDPSGIDIAEFVWQDPDQPDNLFRCYDYQYPWYRNDSKKQIDQTARAIGKALALDTPVPTPSGWTTMGELRAGDMVIGSNGKPTRVLQAYETLNDRPCFEVEFDDGSIIVADEAHLWTTWDKKARVSGRPGRSQHGPEVRTTAQIRDTLLTGGKLPERNHSIPVAEPLDLPDAELPLDPYFLGLWLGDGNSRNAHVTIGDEDRDQSVSELESCGFVLTETAARGHFAVHFPGAHNHKTSSVTAKLRQLGVLENKHIPDIYARGSIAQRTALLQGLMDSDGHITPIGHCENTQVSERLARDLHALVASLGLKPFMEKRRAMMGGVDHGPAYRIGFTPREHIQPFRMPRKAARVRPPRHDRIVGHRRVHAVRAVPTVPVRCITVDAQDSQFLVGHTMISTHNSVGIQMRGFAFPFINAGNEMLVTAPEMIHLEPVTKNIEDRLMSTRLSREMLKSGNQSNGITHRPFEAKFRNGSKIIGRIPQKDGKGVKGQHPRVLEMDEAQDYPDAGWIELVETLRYGDETSRWRAHGVSRGIRDYYYKLSQAPDWFTHRITAMHRPDWTGEERKAKAQLYGSREHADYRRNILGLHGDAMSSLFVLHRLMACVDSNENSAYNSNVYTHVRINDEWLRDSGMPIEALIDLPLSHKAFKRVWIGMDVGMTNHPTEILVFGAEAKPGARGHTEDGERIRCLARIHLERISAMQQLRVMVMLADFYRPLAFGMDRTGLGLPIFQYAQDPESSSPALARAVRGYNFSEKIVVGFEPIEDEENGEWKAPEDRAILGNVLEYSSDQLRLLVDQARLVLPWDEDMLKEFQGQAYYIKTSSTNPYGKKEFNKGKFHALDAARMAALAWSQEVIEKQMRALPAEEAVMLTWAEDPYGAGAMGSADPMFSGW